MPQAGFVVKPNYRWHAGQVGVDSQLGTLIVAWEDLDQLDFNVGPPANTRTLGQRLSTEGETLIPMREFNSA